MINDTLQIKTETATIGVEKSTTSRFWKIWEQKHGSDKWENITPPVKLASGWDVPGFETQAEAEAWATEHAKS